MLRSNAACDARQWPDKAAITHSTWHCLDNCSRPPFLQGQYEMDVHTFCERSVDVMGEESDHIHAQALTDAVQVSDRMAGAYWLISDSDIWSECISCRPYNATNQTHVLTMPSAANWSHHSQLVMLLTDSIDLCGVCCAGAYTHHLYVSAGR